MIDEDSIHDYLDGDLDEAKKRELAQWLLAAPEHRAFYRREVALAAALDSTRVAAAPTALSAPSASGTPPTTSRPPASVTSPPSGTSHSSRHAKRKSGRQSVRIRRQPRSRVAGWSALVAVAAAVVVSTILVLQSSSVPPAHSIQIGSNQGTVSVVRGDTTLSTLPTSLRVGDLVRLGAGASARLEMDHGRTRIFVAENSSVVIAAIREARDRIGTRLELAHGNVLIEAAPQPANAPLRIRSARSEVEVVGTVFSLTALADRDRLLVGHGVVAYSRPAGEQRTQIMAGGFGESDGARLTVGQLGFHPPTAVTAARVTGFSLIDDNTGKAIPGYTQLTSGSVIDLATLSGRRVNLAANVQWPDQNNPGHIVFHYDDASPLAEGGAPYSLLSDLSTAAATTSAERFHNGIHVVVGTPYDGKIAYNAAGKRQVGGNGDPGQSATLIFTVINATP